MRIVPYLKGSKLWPYISRTTPKPSITDTEKLNRWEEIDAQALSTIMMNISPNFQASLDCSSAKTAWDSLVNRYAQADPIAQNLTHAHLHAQCFLEGNMETLPGNIMELQKLREACDGLGVTIMDSQFSGIIMLSMPTPAWDPVISILGRVLDQKVIISCLNTEWSWQQGPTSSKKDSNMIFQASSKPHVKCDNRPHQSQVLGQRQQTRGSIPQMVQRKKRFSYLQHHHNRTVAETPIVWAYSSVSKLDVWIADSAATIHVSSNQNDFTSYCKFDKC